MNRLFCVLFLWLGLLGHDSAVAADSDFGRNWQETRDHQPAGLQLKLTVPKTHFFQGEEINGTLELTNTSPVPYHFWTGNIGRFGRVNGFAFLAANAAGQPVIDPLKWASNALQDLGGMGTDQQLGKWSVTLPTAYWLRFDQPGDYMLYARVDRIHPGASPQPGVENPATEFVPLVSDKITITIDPLTPEEEKQTIADARAKLANGAERGEGAVLLSALQTPSAREALRSLISDKDGSGASNAADMGLMAAPDPRVEAKALLDDVTNGRLPVCVNMEWVYSWTERYDLPWGTSEEFEREHKAAFQRIMDAGVKATGGNGPAYVESLWTQYQSNRLDPKTGTYRALLAAHQLELSQKNKDTVICGWYSELQDKLSVRPLNYFPTPAWVPKMGGEDFLPLVREAVTSLMTIPASAAANDPSAPPMTPQERATAYDERRFKTYALIVLANLKPDEAHPLIRDAILHGDPLFFSGSFPTWDSDSVPMMPTDPMPELDAVLRQKLVDGNLPDVMPLIDRYGSPNLVVDVLRAYTPEKGRDNPEVRDAMLRYLLRCDPAKGVEALEQNLQLRGGGYKTLLFGMLFDRWTPLALPLLEKSLNDPDDDVAVSAIGALERNSCNDDAEKAVVALERIILATGKTNSAGKPDATVQYRDVAGGLSKSKRLKFTADQLARLKTLATYPGSSWVQ